MVEKQFWEKELDELLAPTEELLENDEISVEEAAFLNGYEV